MTDRVISVGDDFTLPAAVNVADVNLPDRLQDGEILPADDYSTNTIGVAMKTAVLGTKPTVVFTSNSIGYGQDNTATGTLPPVNGSSQNRSETPPIEAFNSMMAFIQSASSGVTTVNQAYPGDQTQLGTGNAMTRWAAGVSGDVEIFFCLDTNDAMNYGGFVGGVLTPAQSAEGLAKLIRRCNQRGSQAIVVGGAPVSDNTHNRTIRAYTAAHASVAARLGVTFIDVAELLDTLPSNDLWTDAVHLSKYAYSLIGRRVAAILGRYGTLPRRVAPGITIKPKHGVHGGGSPTTRTGAIDGTVIRLTSGQSIVIPVKVEAPCVPILRLWSETATGTGSGAIIYNAGAVSGSVNRTVNIPTVTGGSSLLRAHPLNLGMDNITISCTSGSLEFEGVTFVDLPGRNTSTASRRIEESTLSGLTLGTPGGAMDATWDAAVDEQVTLSPYGNAANVDCKVDFRVSIAEPASGLLAGVGISAASNYGSTVLLKSGYIAFRNSSNALVVRELDQGTVTDTTVAAVFAAGEFNGVISMAVSATTGNLVVYVNGVAKATITSRWRHYTPIAWANTGTILTIQACSVRTSSYAP